VSSVSSVVEKISDKISIDSDEISSASSSSDDSMYRKVINGE